MGNPMFARICITVNDRGWNSTPEIQEFEKNPWKYFRAANHKSGYDSATGVLTIDTHDDGDVNPVAVGRFQLGLLREGDLVGKVIIVAWRAYKTSPDFDGLRALLKAVYGEILPEFVYDTQGGYRQLEVHQGDLMADLVVSRQLDELEWMTTGGRKKTKAGLNVVCEKIVRIEPEVHF